jgi:hypothetical protein
MNLFRRSSAAAEIWKSDIVAQLKRDRCWICDHAAGNVERDFFWFASEQYYEPEVVDRMRLAQGFCPNHTRRFLQTGAVSVITAVYSYLAWYAIRRLDAARELLLAKPIAGLQPETCRKAAAILRPNNPCPMCVDLRYSEEIDLHALSGTLKLAEVRDAYGQSPGLCLPHFRAAAARAGWNTMVFLTDDMRRRLRTKVPADASGATVLEQTVGWDSEQAFQRGAQPPQTNRPRLNNEAAEIIVDPGDKAGRWSPTFAELLKSLAEPGCPVCNACDRGIYEYLAWLARQMEAQPRIPDSWDASYNICANHLWALYSTSHESAAVKIGSHMIQERLSKLDTLAAALAFQPPDHWPERLRLAFFARCGFSHRHLAPTPPLGESRRSRAAALIESPPARLHRLRTIAFRDQLCQACAHRRAITQQTIDLILRALEDPAGRIAYHAGAGLCLRHCVEAAKLAEAPAALGELLSAQIARLRLLEWELEEASRKFSWSVRYEPKGAETDAWRRAARQFCGV